MTGEWKEVKRHNKGSVFDRLGRQKQGKHKNLRFEELREVSVTVYVSNFPLNLGSRDLWQLCDRHGTVADVYIAQKLSKSGHRFAFVRFLKISDSNSLLEGLNKIWIGSYHLFASMARFDRTQPSQRPQDTQSRIPNKVVNGMKFAEHANGARSYATAVKGNNDNSKVQPDKVPMKKIVLNQSDLLVVPDTSCVVLAKVRDIHLVLNIKKVLRKEGFSDFKCQYVGGLWLWIEFNSKDACLNFKQHKEIKWYFTHIQHISKTFKVDERIVWVELDGLPLSAWTSNAFKKVAGIWGDPLFVDEDQNEQLANGRVCIKTKIHESISDVCSVSINNENYRVRVKEFAGWVPDYDTIEDNSQKDWASNNSDFDEDEQSIHINEEEEGEIKENNIDDENIDMHVDDEVKDTARDLTDEEVKDTARDHTDDEVKDTTRDHTDDEVKVMARDHPDDSETVIKPTWDEEMNNLEAKQNANFANDDKVNNDLEASSSPSKPPGFEGIRFSTSNINHGKKRSGTYSANSHSNVRGSRIGNSQIHKRKSTGSLIDAFISHIEMGSVLGYDMEGSKTDLKKFIDRIGAHGSS
ncbi:hypothetical protein CTI12_AA114520 [Artemisia annua]|uniref:RRM domain-containing protein n=1 Tax=Artemisia annua TaxID=35608 RepID=A0A2U1PTS0_ARTAN|nr:hypothetical protein CTI12_AA114520 [Artemisia annua]